MAQQNSNGIAVDSREPKGSGTYDTAPAIRRRFDERDMDVERIEKIGSDVTFHRGLGDSDTKVEKVRYPGGCPRCETDVMYRSIALNPTGHDDVVYFCSNMQCRHYVGDELRYDMQRRFRADTPTIWDNTARCPECDRRFTIEVKAHEVAYYDWDGEQGSSIIISELCDDCSEAWPKLEDDDE